MSILTRASLVISVCRARPNNVSLCRFARLCSEQTIKLLPEYESPVGGELVDKRDHRWICRNLYEPVVQPLHIVQVPASGRKVALSSADHCEAAALRERGS